MLARMDYAGRNVMGRPLHLSAYLAQSLLTRVEHLWAEAGVESAYVHAMRLALASVEGGEARSGAVCGRLPLLSLPGLCCEAAGGARSQAEFVAAAWSLLYEAAHRLDDAEDGETEIGPPSGFDGGTTINVAIGLMTSASLVLCALGNSEAAHAIRYDFYRTGLEMCAGQHADLTVREPTLEQCWQIAQAKSGSFFALACRAGARLADDDAARLELFGEFGRQLGVLVQIEDDVSGLGPTAGERSDLAAGQRWTLPIAYAMSVMPASDREQLRECLKTAPRDADAEAEARSRVIESGAVLYLTVEAERRRQRAETALSTAAPPSAVRDELLALLRRCLPV